MKMEKKYRKKLFLRDDLEQALLLIEEALTFDSQHLKAKDYRTQILTKQENLRKVVKTLAKFAPFEAIGISLIVDRSGLSKTTIEEVIGLINKQKIFPIDYSVERQSVMLLDETVEKMDNLLKSFEEKERKGTGKKS